MQADGGDEDDDISLQDSEFGYVGQVNPERKPMGWVIQSAIYIYPSVYLSVCLSLFITNTPKFTMHQYPSLLCYRFGTMLWPDLSHYDGQWLNGDRHGWGKHVFPGGDTYEGQWEFGMQCGEGQMTYAGDYGPNKVYVTL